MHLVFFKHKPRYKNMYVCLRVKRTWNKISSGTERPTRQFGLSRVNATAARRAAVVFFWLLKYTPVGGSLLLSLRLMNLKGTSER